MRVIRFLALALTCVSLLIAAAASAQTTTLTEKRSYEVVSVDGNKVVVKTDQGIREVVLPPDFKVNVDGKDVGVADLKPGMKGTALVTTKVTSSPVTVTEVKNADVLAVSGNTIIVRGSDGIKKYTAQDVKDRNVSIMREGERVDISQLRPGDKLTATIITRKPPVVTTEREIHGAMATSGKAAKPASAAAASAPAASAPAASASAPAASASAPAPAAPAPAAEPAAPAETKMAKKLPKTGTHLPLAAGLGFLSLAAGLGLTIRRRKAS
ncbi:MAG TPA: LPXTG cell wall anchor domain-containing protein [Myxococcaceae bacterium]|nr:LPXTG cell wall anchor domain-containing protein [Myxococcaceae bacterium]